MRPPILTEPPGESSDQYYGSDGYAVIFYNLITSLVGLLQYFIVPWILNQGSGYPDGTTRFYMVQFYKQAFTFQNMGTGRRLPGCCLLSHWL